jgi:hypothetical protein
MGGSITFGGIQDLPLTVIAEQEFTGQLTVVQKVVSRKARNDLIMQLFHFM